MGTVKRIIFGGLAVSVLVLFPLNINCKIRAGSDDRLVSTLINRIKKAWVHNAQMYDIILISYSNVFTPMPV